MVTMDQVLAALAPDEPNYDIAAQQLGTPALPILEQLARSQDALLASKAASLAGAIDGPGASAVLEIAAQHPAIGPRAAAAHAARQIRGHDAERIVLTLMDDVEVAVAKFAIRAAAEIGTPPLRQKLQSLANTSPNALVVEEAKKVSKQIP